MLLLSKCVQFRPSRFLSRQLVSPEHSWTVLANSEHVIFLIEPRLDWQNCSHRDASEDAMHSPAPSNFDAGGVPDFRCRHRGGAIGSWALRLEGPMRSNASRT